MGNVLKLGSGKLDCRSGKWLDKSGFHNNGTPVGGARPYQIYDGVMGYKGKTASYVDCGNNSIFDFHTGDFSIATWIFSHNHQSNQNLIGKIIGWGNSTGWVLRIGGNLVLLFQCSDGVTNEPYIATTTNILLPYNNDFLFIIITFTNNTGKIYLNLKEINSQAGMPTPQIINASVEVGGFSFASQPFTGVQADTRLYNHSLTDRERAELYYNSPIYRMQRGLL
ncbi:MAG: LamG domain-containing protein [Nanoarchaeota archaeon]|nr:LamG domain-containing protein [Nanoarchaeota archaeon]